MQAQQIPFYKYNIKLIIFLVMMMDSALCTPHLPCLFVFSHYHITMNTDRCAFVAHDQICVFACLQIPLALNHLRLFSVKSFP